LLVHGIFRHFMSELLDVCNRVVFVLVCWTVRLVYNAFIKKT